jgi:hypothetical protein
VAAPFLDINSRLRGFVGSLFGGIPGCPIGDDDDLVAARDESPEDRPGRVLELDPDDLPHDWYR